MKKILTLILLVVIPVITYAQQEKNKNLETVKFKTSIDCDDCVNTIMSNIPHEKGVKDVRCDLETQEVLIAYRKDKNNSAELRKAIEKLGFTAKELTEEKEKKPIKK